MNNCIYCNYGFCGGCGKTKCGCGNDIHKNRQTYEIAKKIWIDRTLFWKRDETIKSIISDLSNGLSTTEILETKWYVAPEFAVTDTYQSTSCVYATGDINDQCKKCGKPKRWKDKWSNVKECEALIKK